MGAQKIAGTAQTLLPALQTMEEMTQGAVEHGDLSSLQTLATRIESAIKQTHNIVDVMEILYHYWVVAAIGAIYQYGAAFVSPRQFVTIAAVLAYVLMPDLFPGPADDVLLLFLAAQYIGGLQDFAQWILQHDSPPSIPGLVIAGNKRTEIERFLWGMARKHAREIVGKKHDLLQMVKQLGSHSFAEGKQPNSFAIGR